MADPDQEEQARDKLLQSLDKLSSVNPRSLAQAKRLGSAMSFEKGIPYFERLLDLFAPLRESSLDGIPLARLNTLQQSVNQVAGLFERIRDFDPEQQQPVGVRDGLIVEARDLYDRCFENITPTISYAIRTGIDLVAVERSAREALGRIEDLVRQSQESQASHESESQKALEAIRAAAAEAGVSQQAIHFRDEAKSHRKMAMVWLGATAVSAVAAFVYAIIMLCTVASSVEGLDDKQLWHTGLAKVAVFSVLSFAVIWCGRVYKSNRHNYVVNKHRQNALSTFKAFVEAAEDPETKNAVLVEASRCVFSPQHSGYLGRESLGPSAPSQILEVLKGSGQT